MTAPIVRLPVRASGLGARRLWRVFAADPAVGDVEQQIDHPDLGAGVRKRNVRRDRRPVQEVVNVGEFDLALPAELADAGDDAARRVVPASRASCRP